MSIRLKVALALVALAILTAGGVVLWQRSFEYAIADITYVRAPRQSAEGQPTQITARGRWPGPGFRLRRAEVVVDGVTLTPRLTGRRRPTASAGSGEEVEVTLKLPELPSAQYALQAGDLGTLTLMMYRLGSAPAAPRKAGRDGDVTGIRAPVVAEVGRPFRVELEGAWDDYGCEIGRVTADRRGPTYLASVLGTYDTNDQVVAEGYGLDFTAGLNLTLTEPGLFGIRDRHDGDPWLCVRGVRSLPTGEEIEAPVIVESLSCLPSIHAGESVLLQIWASVPDGCAVRTQSRPTEQGAHIDLSGLYTSNTQAVHAGSSATSITVLVPSGSQGPGTMTIEVADGTAVLTAVVAVEP